MLRTKRLSSTTLYKKKKEESFKKSLNSVDWKRRSVRRKRSVIDWPFWIESARNSTFR